MKYGYENKNSWESRHSEKTNINKLWYTVLDSFPYKYAHILEKKQKHDLITRGRVALNNRLSCKTWGWLVLIMDDGFHGR